MKKIYLTIGFLLLAVTLSAVQRSDTVLHNSSAPKRGWNFEVGGCIGLAGYSYGQRSKSTNSYHIKNTPGLSGNIGLGINYYFLPWMGIGTGAQFSTYGNKAVVSKPWELTTDDKYGDTYTITSTPYKLAEKQQLYMMEIPFALKFRYRPSTFGFTGTAGMKIGIPIYCGYKMAQGGSLDNSVYYPKFDLTIHDVPNVVEDISISEASGKLPIGFSDQGSLRVVNFAAYMEAGMLVRIHQYIDLAASVYFNYYVNDVIQAHGMSELGFGINQSAGEYPIPYNADYNGVLRTQEAEELHPWSVGVKVAVQFNTGHIKKKHSEPNEQPLDTTTSKIAIPDSMVVIVKNDSIPAEIADSVPTAAEQPNNPHDEAIEQIYKLAQEYGIDLCREICVPDTVFVYDTIYIQPNGLTTYSSATYSSTHSSSTHSSTTTVQTTTTSTDSSTPIVNEEPQKEMDAVVAELEEELKKAVIYFDLDKADPILQPRDILERIAKVLRRHPNQKIRVNGHACKLGKPEYNRQLALRRAFAVSDRLRALGVADNQMYIASLGSDMPFRYNGEHQLSKDRRVEIVPVENKSTSTGTTQTSQSTQMTQSTTSTQTTKPAYSGQTVHAGSDQSVQTVPLIMPGKQNKPKQVTEVVKRGTTLAQIARRHYGETDYWVFIYEANRDRISDPGDLEVGTELVIPDLNERLKGMTKEQAMEEAGRLKVAIIWKKL